MSGGFTIHFPAKVGDVVYSITKKGYVQKEIVTGYMVRGDGEKIEVCVRYKDHNGDTYSGRLPFELFGKILFLTEQQAVLALRERLGV